MRKVSEQRRTRKISDSGSGNGEHRFGRRRRCGQRRKSFGGIWCFYGGYDIDLRKFVFSLPVATTVFFITFRIDKTMKRHVRITHAVDSSMSVL